MHRRGKKSQITNMYLWIHSHLMPEKESKNLMQNLFRKNAFYHRSTEQLIIIFTLALQGYLFLGWLIVECTWYL